MQYVYYMISDSSTSMYSISSAAQHFSHTAWRYWKHSLLMLSEVDEWDHHKVCVTWSSVAHNKLVYPIRRTGNPICQSMCAGDKGSLLLIRSPESHLIIHRNDIVVFFHLPLNGKEDRPCHIVPPYSRYSVSDTLYDCIEERFLHHKPTFVMNMRCVSEIKGFLSFRLILFWQMGQRDHWYANWFCLDSWALQASG